MNVEGREYRFGNQRAIWATASGKKYLGQTKISVL